MCKKHRFDTSRCREHAIHAPCAHARGLQFTSNIESCQSAGCEQPLKNFNTPAWLRLMAVLIEFFSSSHIYDFFSCTISAGFFLCRQNTKSITALGTAHTHHTLEMSQFSHIHDCLIFQPTNPNFVNSDLNFSSVCILNFSVAHLVSTTHG